MNTLLFVICYFVFAIIGTLHIVQYISVGSRLPENLIDEAAIMKSIANFTAITIVVVIMYAHIFQR